MICPLCKSQKTISFTANKDVLFWKCNECFLIFKDPSFYLPSGDEKYRYLQHNNTPDCPGYVNFLNKALNPTIPFLNNDMVGMDFGCGPTTVLTDIISEKGITCFPYDPFFYPELPDERLDFIISTECFEHFHNPHKEIHLITSLLIPGGILTIMTLRWNDDIDLTRWSYMHDHTHVCFFHNKTFQFICKKNGFTIEHDDGARVIILRKNVAWEN